MGCKEFHGHLADEKYFSLCQYKILQLLFLDFSLDFQSSNVVQTLTKLSVQYQKERGTQLPHNAFSLHHQEVQQDCFPFWWVLIINVMSVLNFFCYCKMKIYPTYKEETLKWPKKTIMKEGLNKRKGAFLFEVCATQVLTIFCGCIIKRNMLPQPPQVANWPKKPFPLWVLWWRMWWYASEEMWI